MVNFTGKCDQLGSLETASLNAGVPALVLNHAHVLLTLKPLKGGDLKGAREEISAVEGVAGITSSAAGLELHSDLEKLTIENLKAAAARKNCEVVVNQTFEYVKYKVVEGEFGAFRMGADGLKGVMVVREEGDNTLGMWINKAMVRTEQLEKIKDVKVERQ